MRRLCDYATNVLAPVGVSEFHWLGRYSMHTNGDAEQSGQPLGRATSKTKLSPRPLLVLSANRNECVAKQTVSQYQVIGST
jgi:hypothetical protein